MRSTSHPTGDDDIIISFYGLETPPILESKTIHLDIRSPGGFFCPTKTPSLCKPDLDEKKEHAAPASSQHPHDRSISISGSCNRSGTELRVELGVEGSSCLTAGDEGGDGDPATDRSHIWILVISSVPSTRISPCSLPLPRMVAWYLESSPVLLCFFFRAGDSTRQ